MKKLLTFISLLSLLSSCATLTGTSKPTNDVDLMKEIALLNEQGKCSLVIEKAKQMDVYFSESFLHREALYLSGSCLNKLKDKEASKFWLEFSKLYPNYLAPEVQIKLDESKTF